MDLTSGKRFTIHYKLYKKRQVTIAHTKIDKILFAGSLGTIINYISQHSCFKIFCDCSIIFASLALIATNEVGIIFSFRYDKMSSKLVYKKKYLVIFLYDSIRLMIIKSIVLSMLKKKK